MTAINVLAAVAFTALVIAGTVGFVMWAFAPIPPAEHRPVVQFNDEPTMCTCGLTWFECRQPQSIDDIVMSRPGRRG